MRKFSEKELIKLSTEQVTLISKEAFKEMKIVEEFTSFFPCMIHLNNLSDLAVTFFNKYALEKFQKDLKEIINEGVDFNFKIVDPASTKIVVPKLLNHIKSEDCSMLFFEQKIRYSQSANYINHLSFSKLSNNLKALITFSFPSSLLEVFIRKRIFRDNPVFDKYVEKFSMLSKREKEVLKHIAVGMPNSKISQALCISALTVKTHRQNIFRKLGTNNISELTRIASYFDLLEQN